METIKTIEGNRARKENKKKKKRNTRKEIEQAKN